MAKAPRSNVKPPKTKSHSSSATAVNGKAKKAAAEKLKKADHNVERIIEKPNTSRKRGRVSSDAKAVSTDSASAEKRAKLDERLDIRNQHLDKTWKSGGMIFTLGQGDTGQLGLGPDVMERSKPSPLRYLEKEKVVAICAGGMHTLCLTQEGQVYSFGCNDEGTLGRTTDEDEEAFIPGKVDVPGKVVQISAGDSHSVALTDDGKVYYWGTFRDSSGSFGLTPDGQIQKTPVPLAHHLHVKKISSGADHVALLTREGQLYTIGCAEHGQLGRVCQRFTERGGRRGLDLLLKPDRVHSKNRRTVFADVWAGSYNTIALTADNDIMVCGLNNYCQLGVKDGQVYYCMVKSNSYSQLSKELGCAHISFGLHHALALDGKGGVYSVGRMEYGRLGLGQESQADANVPTPIPDLHGRVCVDVSCGSNVSFAVTQEGECFSWGMGTNDQLGLEDSEDAWVPTRMMGKQLQEKRVMSVSGGGQHTVVLAS